MRISSRNKLFISIALLLFICAIVAVFWGRIQTAWIVHQYVQTFKPENIDANFRSLYMQYPSVRVAREGEISPLLKAERPLPNRFFYKGAMRELSEWLERSKTTGFIVLKDGVIVHEEYRRGNSEKTQAIAFSVSKSFVSFLVGNAVRDGQISLNQSVDYYAPILASGGYKGVTVKNVLQMASGIKFSEDYGDLKSDIVRYITELKRGSINRFTAGLVSERPQGTVNHYISSDTQVLAMVLEGATGVPFQKYFADKLWTRLGAEADAYWLTDLTGEVAAAGGFNGVLRDYARFGLLYLNEGKNFRSEELVPAQWVHDSVTPDAPYLLPGRPGALRDVPFGYGYQWWLPVDYQGDYAAIGIYGQFIYVNPAKKVVIAKTSAYYNYNIDGQELENESMHAFQALANAL
ncbi:serine hydrolase domain-containing protein [Ochrobactrum teleogrylli]|uniref:Serine hydrolase n=1 Tax=Ochrobactrum teleogrylli TaxID=2479765 RepID=A0ABY2XYN0_9HYPH|nr:serine hydrolase [[Ochrobactrum] teleogrylli]TNV09855.1 serine hydrolase [[Ochrobactrum] teleogrylli]